MKARRTKPLIAVTIPRKGAWPSWILIRYLIWRAGGKALRLSPGRKQQKKRVNAVILGGGADLDPGLYKEKVIRTIKRESRRRRRWNLLFVFSVILWLSRKVLSLKFTSVDQDKERDEFEFNIMQRVYNHQLPVLGICRGAQLINVFFGGSLYQDIDSFHTERTQLRTVLPKNRIEIHWGSLLHEIVKQQVLYVNELHHQSVKNLGQGLRITATDGSGIVEAIEHKEISFLLGVQWHPEFLPLFDSQRRIFKALVAEAKKTPAIELSVLVSAGLY